MNRLRCLPLLIPLLLIGCDRPAEPVEPVATRVTAPTLPSLPTARSDDSPSHAMPPLAPGIDASGAVSTAQAVLMPTRDHRAGGSLLMQIENDALRVTGRITGLTTLAAHGFHIHEQGDCSAPDGSSAGGHFNPTGLPHGQRDADPHHAGDLPNLHADAKGETAVDVLLPGLEIGTKGPRDVLGRAAVVHEQADDYRTQPAGNSGARIACGVIGHTLSAAPIETIDDGNPR